MPPADTIPPVDSLTAGPRDVPVGIGAPVVAGDTTPARRRKAVEVSDTYATVLKIHYIASYATIPIFAAEGIIGEQLFHSEQNGYPPSRSLKGAHDAVAGALGVLFGVNTITGSWNWWATRHEAKGRAWRTVHAALMLVADAGFAYTAVLGDRAGFERGGGNVARDQHKQAAEISAGIALASYIMMWKPIRGDR
jgi:hypothetical protein